MAGNISEYTHVWEVQAPSMHPESTPSPASQQCPHLHTFKRVPTCDLHAGSSCACVGRSGGIYGTKESIYDTQRRLVPVSSIGGKMDDTSKQGAPLYFDMDLTASIPHQARKGGRMS